LSCALIKEYRGQEKKIAMAKPLWLLKLRFPSNCYYWQWFLGDLDIILLNTDIMSDMHNQTILHQKPRNFSTH